MDYKKKYIKYKIKYLKLRNQDGGSSTDALRSVSEEKRRILIIADLTNQEIIDNLKKFYGISDDKTDEDIGVYIIGVHKITDSNDSKYFNAIFKTIKISNKLDAIIIHESVNYDLLSNTQLTRLILNILLKNKNISFKDNYFIIFNSFLYDKLIEIDKTYDFTPLKIINTSKLQLNNKKIYVMYLFNNNNIRDRPTYKDMQVNKYRLTIENFCKKKILDIPVTKSIDLSLEQKRRILIIADKRNIEELRIFYSDLFYETKRNIDVHIGCVDMGVYNDIDTPLINIFDSIIEKIKDKELDAIIIHESVNYNEELNNFITYLILNKLLVNVIFKDKKYIIFNKFLYDNLIEKHKKLEMAQQKILNTSILNTNILHLNNMQIYYICLYNSDKEIIPTESSVPSTKYNLTINEFCVEKILKIRESIDLSLEQEIPEPQPLIKGFIDPLNVGFNLHSFTHETYKPSLFLLFCYFLNYNNPELDIINVCVHKLLDSFGSYYFKKGPKDNTSQMQHLSSIEQKIKDGTYNPSIDDPSIDDPLINDKAIDYFSKTYNINIVVIKDNKYEFYINYSENSTIDTTKNFMMLKLEGTDNYSIYHKNGKYSLDWIDFSTELQNAMETYMHNFRIIESVELINPIISSRSSSTPRPDPSISSRSPSISRPVSSTPSRSPSISRSQISIPSFTSPLNYEFYIDTYFDHQYDEIFLLSLNHFFEFSDEYIRMKYYNFKKKLEKDYKEYIKNYYPYIKTDNHNNDYYDYFIRFISSKYELNIVVVIDNEYIFRCFYNDKYINVDKQFMLLNKETIDTIIVYNIYFKKNKDNDKIYVLKWTDFPEQMQHQLLLSIKTSGFYEISYPDHTQHTPILSRSNSSKPISPRPQSSIQRSDSTVFSSKPISISELTPVTNIGNGDCFFIAICQAINNTDNLLGGADYNCVTEMRDIWSINFTDNMYEMMMIADSNDARIIRDKEGNIREEPRLIPQNIYGITFENFIKELKKNKNIFADASAIQIISFYYNYNILIKQRENIFSPHTIYIDKKFIFLKNDDNVHYELLKFGEKRIFDFNELSYDLQGIIQDLSSRQTPGVEETKG